MNDIERYGFWNREAKEFLKKERLKKEQQILRWDSCTNKVPFICAIDPCREELAVEDVNVYPTSSL